MQSSSSLTTNPSNHPLWAIDFDPDPAGNPTLSSAAAAPVSTSASANTAADPLTLALGPPHPPPPPSSTLSLPNPQSTDAAAAAVYTSISFAYASSPSDDGQDMNATSFKNVITHQPLRDASDDTNASRYNPKSAQIAPPSRTRSKSFNAGYSYLADDLLYPSSTNPSKNLPSTESPFPDSFIWADDRAAPSMHRRASTVPVIYAGLWDTPTAAPSLIDRAPPAVMEDPSIQNYYRQGRRFSHAPTLYQDWHDPRVNRTGALEHEYDLEHFAPGVIDSRRRHSLAGPPMYPPQSTSSSSRYLNEALESLHLEDPSRESSLKAFVSPPLRASPDYNAPTPLRNNNEYNPTNLRTDYLRNVDNDLNTISPSAAPLSVSNLANAPLYDEINDYFENTEHRTRAWVEAGKNLQMQTNHLVHWPLYIVEFKAGRMDYFYVGDRMGPPIRKGDLVIVEADRGKDLGKVVVQGIQNPQQLAMHQSILGDGLLSCVNMAVGSMGVGNDVMGGGSSQGGGAPLTGPAVLGQLGPKDIHPKRIYRTAQSSEVSQLVAKSADEAKAQALCQAKIRQRKLPMEIVDAEYQWDRRKLTFYFVADRRIDFRELVRELFKIYKTRIWMCAVSPHRQDMDLATQPTYI
ncbi:hypothetical protein SeMB42_g06506 [Synchytrium endobioticum]|uniref:PSP1 C-terminal domain-containing protein n=1 Tax=Synchytrium endobioticum TaxID=286115 RepID=A0A507CBW7_9FUNG|nr:hypothetical protein SeMB42_g06506 [Synchytrium endobioticum]